MNDLQDAGHPPSLGAASREAERLIEQRIEELRALALAPMEAPGPGNGSRSEWATTGGDAEFAPSPPAGHSRASSTRTALGSADAFLRPSAGEAQRPQEQHAPAPPRTHGAGPELLVASMSRLEAALHEDVARIELTLRSWGNPREAARQYGDQTLAALGEFEQRMSALLHSTSEQLQQLAHRPDGAAQQRLIEAIAAWTVKVEQASTAQAERLTRELRQAAHDARTSDEQLQQAMREAVSAAVAGLEERATASAEQLQAMAETARQAAREDGIAVRGSVQQASDRVLQATEQLHTHVDRLHTQQATALRQSSEEVHQQLQELPRQLVDGVAPVVEQAVDGRISRLEGGMDERIASLERLVEERVGSFERHVDSRLDELQHKLVQELGGRLDEALTTQARRVEHLLGEFEERVDRHARRYSQGAGDAVRDVASALQAMREHHDRASKGVQERMRTELGSIRHDVLAELDHSRVQAGEDTQLVLDSMVDGWNATIEALQRAEARIAVLEQYAADLDDE